MSTQYFPIHSQGVRDIALNVLSSMPLPCEVTIQPYRTKRSLAQNRLYWKWLGEIAEQMQVPDKNGDLKRLNKDQWHALCAEEFLGVDEIVLPTKVYRIPFSTKKLKVNEFCEYLTKIEAHFLEKGVALTFTDDYGTAMGKS